MKALSVSLMPTYLCNYHCSYCYLGDLTKDKTCLDISLLKARLSELSCHYEISGIDIFGGEISLLKNDYLDELFKTCRQFTKSIAVTSNLTRLSFLSLIDKYSIKLTVSVNIERDYFLKTINTIKQLKSEYSILSVVLPSILSCNVKDLLDFYESLHPSSVTFIEYYPARRARINYSITNQAYSDFLKQVIDLRKNYSYSIGNLQDLNYLCSHNYIDNVFITPYGNFASTQYDNEGLEYFVEHDTLNDWLNNSNKCKTYQTECLTCQYKHKCLAEHIKPHSKDDECAGHPSLIKYIDLL